MPTLAQLKARKTAAGLDGINPRFASTDIVPNVIKHASFYKEQFKNDVKVIQSLSSVERKKELKKQYITKYYPFIDDFIANPTGTSNTIVTMLIWLFDAQEIPRAVDLALVLIDKNANLPQHFGRNLPTFVVDAVYDWANELYKKNESGNPYLERLAERADKWDLHEAVASKLYAMTAKHNVIDGDFSAAVMNCDKAIAVNPTGHGVKTLRSQALAQLPQPTIPRSPAIT